MTLRYDAERQEILVSDGGGPELRDDILALVHEVIADAYEDAASIADDVAKHMDLAKQAASPEQAVAIVKTMSMAKELAHRIRARAKEKTT